MTNSEKAVLCRAVWETRRSDMEKYLRSRKFNSKSIGKVIDTFIESMVYIVQETGDLAFGIAVNP